MEKLSLKQLKEFIQTSSLDDLKFELGRYCGPHHVLLREKKYSYEACKHLQRLLFDAIATKEVDNFLMDDMLSETE